MLDFNFNFTHLAVAIFGIIAGGGVATCAYLVYGRKQVDDIINTDPPLQVPDMQVVISLYKGNPVKAVAYTANETRLPECVQDDAINKAITELGYTKSHQAVCTKSTTLEPVSVEVKPEVGGDMPETREHALNVICESPSEELKHLEKIKAGIQKNGGKNAKASEPKAD
jgi:hypothetical protein